MELHADDLPPIDIQDDARPPQESIETLITEISAQDTPFATIGTCRVKVGARSMLLGIKSVPTDIYQQEVQRLKPKKLPRISTPDGRYVVDEESPAYSKYLIEGSYLRVLLGLAQMTLKDRKGKVVWRVPGEGGDIPAAIQALKDTGLTDQQMFQVVQAINQLTRADQLLTQEATDDFLAE